MNLNGLPDLDSSCGKYFSYRDFVECGETWQIRRVNNVPTQQATYTSLHRLAAQVLDPVVDHFGPVELTYGLACGALTKLIKKHIAPRVDQHSAHELSKSGKLICDRGGAACDFSIFEVDSLTVAQWVVRNTAFDRLYYYSADRPIHVSTASEPKRQVVLVKRDSERRQVRPIVVSQNQFLDMSISHEDEQQ